MGKALMKSICPVIIIGAGPYGLSLAAYLRAHGIEHRIFGKPMDFWLTQMPSGMNLKSDGFASNLYDPEDSFTLKRFCQERDIAYADIGIPVRLDTFAAYGLAFKSAMVPNLEERIVVSLKRQPRGFAITLEDGEVVAALSVVVAVGIAHFTQVPSVLANLPTELLTHSSQHHNLERFAGRDIIVIGGGSSATDLATLLFDVGANVQLIARRNSLNFNEPAEIKDFSNSLWRQIREPMSGIGPGWRYKMFGDAPWLFHRFPQSLRHRVVRRSHGPAGAWFVKDRILNGPTLLLGCTVERADVRGDGAHIVLRTSENDKREVVGEHVIAATGYKIDIRKLSFLSSEIQLALKTSENTPVLSGVLQSSIPGLYFVGTTAANSFGPVMRFAFGARFTARRLSRVFGARIR
jgi:Pyridine nucleotide-disulphide oxidoreductase